MISSHNYLVEEAKKFMLAILDKDSSGHDYYHSLRVYNNAMRIAKNYDVNEFLVALASILHDVDDPKISKDTNHARGFLKKHNINEKQVMDIIDNISFSSHKAGKTVSSLEGKIVQDADRLEALGAIGIARCFAYSGYKDRPMYKGSKDDDSSIAHFYQKLFKLPDLMNTVEAKAIALERVDFMNVFIKKFYQEWE